MTALTSLTVPELRSGLDKRDFSSRDLTLAYLAKIEADADLNAFLEVPRERALKQADAADERLRKGEYLPLLGIPVAVKDMLLTTDVKTTAGSRILADFIPPYSSTAVRNLDEGGAVMIGKTNMDEFAMGSSNENSAFGPVKNPWDRSRVPGGSSGGSAAAVAADLVPLSLGTDTGGSIRQPAALCGLTGLKPTYGRVSRYGVVAYASSLDQVGGFARDAAGCAVLTQVIAGHDPFDSTSAKLEKPDFSEALRGDVHGLRLGMPREFFTDGIQSEVRLAVDAALKQLEQLGARIVEISLPHTKAALATYYILAPAEASSNLARYDGIRFGYRASGCKDLSDLYRRTRSEGFGEEVKRRIMIGTYVLSAGYYDAYYLRAQKARKLIAADFQNAFEKECDAIVCPTSPTTAFRLGEKTDDPLAMYLSDIFTIPVNLAGLPGMSIPCGLDTQQLPIGLQLIGKAWDESTLFRIAAAYQHCTDWHRRKPSN